jgi:hypothetical protein
MKCAIFSAALPTTTAASSPSVSLILFSTKTGDPWLLDPADQLAARLAREGESEPIHIEETDTTFAIGWKGRYRIEGPAFVYSDDDTGRTATILGYPTDKLTQAV